MSYLFLYTNILSRNKSSIYASSKSLEEVKQKREKILERYNLGLQTDISKKTLNDRFDEWMELYVVVIDPMLYVLYKIYIFHTLLYSFVQS